MPDTVAQLRRYPVKSMGGEALDRVTLDERGIVGDRWYAVVDAEGRFASGKDTRRFRRRDAVFDHAASTGHDGAVTVSGPDGTWTVGDPRLDQVLSDRMQAPVRVLPETDTPHYDAGSVSLVGSATLDWCAERWSVDADPRRLRVNIVVATTEPFVEETWLGRRIAIGSAELDVVERAPRCRMIDIDQDGARAEGRWLKPLTAEREMCVAVYADVAAPGEIATGDVITLTSIPTTTPRGA